MSKQKPTKQDLNELTQSQEAILKIVSLLDMGMFPGDMAVQILNAKHFLKAVYDESSKVQSQQSNNSPK